MSDGALVHPKPWRCRLGRHKMPTDPNKWLMWSKADWPGWAYAQASCERCFQLVTNEVQR